MFVKIASVPFRFRLLVELAVIAAIIAAYYLLFLSPLHQEQIKIEREYDDIVYRINDLKPYALSYGEFTKQLSAMEEQLAIVAEALPDESGYYVLYDEAVGLAEKNGVKVTLFQPSGEKPIDDFHSGVEFNLHMETTYSNFVKYLYDLNYLDKVFNLRDMEIRAKTSEGGERLLGVTANLNSYRFNSSAVAGRSGE